MKYVNEQILENDFICAHVLPRCGGKILRLVDKRFGFDWLWRNPHLAVREPVYGDSYSEGLDSGGWDEVIPSVAPCQLPGGHVIPDHGEAVQSAWRVLHASDDLLCMSVSGRSLDFCLERSLQLRGRDLVFDYHLKSEAASAFPWLWCAHPLLPFGPEIELLVACDFEVGFAMGAAKSLVGRRVSWPSLPSRNLAWAAKLFSAFRATNEITARHASGARLRFSWESASIPYLALWINNGAWSGTGSPAYFNVGIEPTMLPVDDLSEASNPPYLEPGGGVSWSLTLSFN